jgi:AbrB family looped-hinge helix DNA binding protein
MTASPKLTTTLSTKGQVILPKAIRQRRRWDVGTQLEVEDTPEGVLLRPAPLFEASEPDQVFGALKSTGPIRSVEEMDAAVAEEAHRRHARDRY